MGFFIGFLCGILFTLVIAPFVVKWIIRRKLNKLTGGIF